MNKRLIHNFGPYCDLLIEYEEAVIGYIDVIERQDRLIEKHGLSDELSVSRSDNLRKLKEIQARQLELLTERERLLNYAHIDNPSYEPEALWRRWNETWSVSDTDGMPQEEFKLAIEEYEDAVYELYASIGDEDVDETKLKAQVQLLIWRIDELLAPKFPHQHEAERKSALDKIRKKLHL